jgi:hypothetical protein
VLCDSDCRDVEAHAHEARNATQRWVQPPMAIDEKQIGLPREPVHHGLDCRGFSERKIGRNVGKVDLEFRDRNLKCLQLGGVKDYRSGEGTVACIGDIRAAESLWFRWLILFSYAGGKFSLFLSQSTQEGHFWQAIDKAARLDASRNHDRPLAPEFLEEVAQDWATVRSNHSVSSWSVWVLEQPRRDRPRRPHIA